eukprot:468195-Prorocentrum_minimum.AAC.1
MAWMYLDSAQPTQPGCAAGTVGTAQCMQYLIDARVFDQDVYYYGTGCASQPTSKHILSINYTHTHTQPLGC